MAINIQALEAVIQDVFLYHSSITSDTWCFCHIIENQRIAFFLLLKKAYEIIE